VSHKKLLFDWCKLYKIKSIELFNGDILIVRENSISTLMNVEKEQFEKEMESDEKLMEYLEMSYEENGRNSVENYKLSVTSDDGEYQIPY
jgi:hypothetical protein